MKLYKENELANKTVTSNVTHLSYKMPNKTFKFIATPQNKSMGQGSYYDESAINENGVCISTTVTCSENPDAIKYDPFDKNGGVGEDNLCQIIASSATSARNAMEVVRDLLQTKTMYDANGI